jgi:hypothetical protein
MGSRSRRLRSPGDQRRRPSSTLLGFGPVWTTPWAESRNAGQKSMRAGLQAILRRPSSRSSPAEDGLDAGGGFEEFLRKSRPRVGVGDAPATLASRHHGRCRAFGLPPNEQGKKTVRRCRQHRQSTSTLPTSRLSFTDEPSPHELR